jgi:putative transposase
VWINRTGATQLKRGECKLARLPAITLLCAYTSAVLRDLDSQVIAIKACRDHVHILFALGKNHSLAQVVMEAKRATSKWIKTQGKEFAGFHWQSGYGAFSIGQSGVDEVKL